MPNDKPTLSNQYNRMKIQTISKTISTLVILVAGSLFAATEQSQSTDLDADVSLVEGTESTAPEESAPDYVALIKESLRDDEVCAPYVDTISVILEDHKVTLAGEVETIAVKHRIEEIVRNTTYFEVINELTVAAEQGEDSKDTEQSEETETAAT